jgi:hypothetical protein
MYAYLLIVHDRWQAWDLARSGHSVQKSTPLTLADFCD